LLDNFWRFICGDPIPVGSLWDNGSGFVYECHSNRGGNAWFRLYVQDRRPGKLTIKQPTSLICSPRSCRIRMKQCRLDDVAVIAGESI
jgi:hypothetical protein